MLKEKNKKIVFISVVVLFVILAYYNQFNQKPNNYRPNKKGELTVLEDLNTGSSNELNEKIIVHLTGEVNNAGIYELKKDARLLDLIKAAGGLKEKADLKNINLAEAIFDGQKIIIPKINNQSNDLLRRSLAKEELNFNDLYNSSAESSNLININRADQKELEKLSGIGPSKAAAILKYRKEKGRFSKKEDLLEITGIGEKTLANIEEEISLR